MMQTYTLSFARRQFPSTFNKANHWALYNKLLMGGPTAIEVSAHTTSCFHALHECLIRESAHQRIICLPAPPNGLTRAPYAHTYIDTGMCSWRRRWRTWLQYLMLTMKPPTKVCVAAVCCVGMHVTFETALLT